jgi:pimeloyl-ACP methyl ester carboxylesterase
VDRGVTLEVLDWGGDGPPLVFLTGLGNTAHVFDDFAPKFTAKHHVYAITRRGFGASSTPPATGLNYDADRLGDDVLAVVDALKLNRPVLAGHSVAGEELSSIGTRHPEKVSGLIYLDAAYLYAFYEPVADTRMDDGNTRIIDTDLLRRELDRWPAAGSEVSEWLAEIKAMQALLPRVEKELAQTYNQFQGMKDGPWTPDSPQQRASMAILNGQHKYGGVKPPTLALVAEPMACASNCDSPAAKAQAENRTAYADAFEAGNPSAHVVRLANASHYVWRSNEADVEREMNVFMDTLPKP